MGKTARTEQVGTNVMRVVEELREKQEVEREVARDTGKQLIFRAGEQPMLLRRIRYDKSFPKSWYNDDPDFADDPGRLFRVRGDDLGGTIMMRAAGRQPKTERRAGLISRRSVLPQSRRNRRRINRSHRRKRTMSM